MLRKNGEMIQIRRVFHVNLKMYPKDVFLLHFLLRPVLGFHPFSQFDFQIRFPWGHTTSVVSQRRHSEMSDQIRINRAQWPFLWLRNQHKNVAIWRNELSYCRATHFPHITIILLLQHARGKKKKSHKYKDSSCPPSSPPGECNSRKGNNRGRSIKSPESTNVSVSPILLHI